MNASPDLRQQILSDRDLVPTSLRDSPIHAIILSSADTDSVMGLLHLREFQPLRVFATDSVRRILTEENSLFRVLERSDPPVQWERLPLNRPISIDSSSAPPSGLCCQAVPLWGHFPDYVGRQLRATLREEEAVVGLLLTEGDKRFFFAPTLPVVNDEARRAVAESCVVMLDGTFWTEDELMRVRGRGQASTEIGHVPLSAERGVIEQLTSPGSARRILIHLNNTNPVLDQESDAYRTVLDSGWEVGYDGMEITL